MDDNFFQNSLCITSMKQKLSGPIEAHGPFIILLIDAATQKNPIKKHFKEIVSPVFKIRH